MKIDISKKIVVSSGGGISSGLGLPVWLATNGIWDFDIITARLPNEHPDLYRLHNEVSKLFGRPVIDIWDGKCESPIDLFLRRGFLGNNRIDLCSEELKRATMRKYIKTHYDASNTQLALGITYHEIDRTLSIMKNWSKTGYDTVFPLEDNQWGRSEWITFCFNILGFVPTLYLMLFVHNNCDGACVKAGLYQWVKLLEFLPDVYDQWERGEKAFQQKYDCTHTILKRRGMPISLTELREDYQSRKSSQLTLFDMDTIPNQYMAQIARFEALDLSDLDDTPACSFCDSMG